ncbi:MAG: flagellar hook-associated protein FlgK [Myxococcota bacterium]|nr:flagellar hook-associated protein FlgK [Myxococcota bacterium]
MDSIKSLMGGAANAIGAHKASLALTSKNIANANTEGYTRQRITLMSSTLGNVTTRRASSFRSATIQRAILGAQQSYGYQSGRLQSLQLAEPGLNDLDGSGVSAALDNFFSALSALSNDPSDVNSRQSLLAQAQALAGAVNVAAKGIESARNAAEQDASLTVTAVNQIVLDIAALNGQIDKTPVEMGQAELIDQRDVLLNDLAQYMEVNTLDQDDGTVLVYAAGGQPLILGDDASQMTLTGGGNAALGLAIQKPDGGVITMSDPPGGSLGGIIEARDDTLRTSLDELDQMAFSLASQVNTIHSAGTALDGTTGHNFFAPLATAAGAAEALSVDDGIKSDPLLIASAGDPTLLPGDNQVLKDIIALQSTAVVGGKTLYESYDIASSTVTLAMNDASSQMRASQARLSEVTAMRDSRSAVSIAEEMVELNASERAFDAVSRVFDTADKLYDTLLQMV